MAWPDQQEALAWLQGQGVAPEAADVALRAAGGRPGDALALAHSGGGKDMAAWSQLPRALAKGDVAAPAPPPPPPGGRGQQKSWLQPTHHLPCPPPLFIKTPPHTAPPRAKRLLAGR